MRRGGLRWLATLPGRVRVALSHGVPKWLVRVTQCWGRILGIRILFVTTPGRIGHEQFELDTYYREIHGSDSGNIPRKHILFFPRGEASNHEALRQWERRLTLREVSPRLYKWLKEIFSETKWTWDFFPYGCHLDRRAEAYEVFARYGDKPAFLSLTDRQIQQGKDNLEKLGLARDSWFVCVHCRSAGYSEWDDHLHAYRNSPVENYLAAMEEIVSRGGICFRMGGPEMPALPETDGVVDYAHSPARSEFMDMFLCGQCRFFVGCSSGLFMLSQAFGRPCGLVDMSPIGAAAYGVNDLFAPKLVRRKAGGELMSFPEAFAHECCGYRFTHLYEEAGLEVVNNTPEEIRDLTRDMFAWLERGEEAFSEADRRLQAEYRALFQFHHYGHGHGSKIAPSFIRKYHQLLLDSPAAATP